MLSPMTQMILERYMPEQPFPIPGPGTPPTIPGGSVPGGGPAPNPWEPITPASWDRSDPLFGKRQLMRPFIDRRIQESNPFQVNLSGSNLPLNYMETQYEGPGGIKLSPPPIDRRSHDFMVEKGREFTPDRLPAPAIKSETVAPELEPGPEATGTAAEMEQLRQMYRRGDISLQQILLGMTDIPIEAGGSAGSDYYTQYPGFQPSQYGSPSGKLAEILKGA